jgi:2-polyprenyl-6-methoxyphenol hydroxylase-like FAD-dependent oxidoreductase
MRQSTDVFVIGGGPAGLAAAIAAREQGFNVMVADGAEPPIDKACGEGLMPDSIEALQQIGIQVSALDGFPLRGMRFVDGDLSVKAEFDAAHGIGVRRVVLHQQLVDRAREAGVVLLWRTPITGISSDSVKMPGKTISARWIIGADGIRSRVRGWAGLESLRRTDVRYAFRQHYHV